MPKLSNLGLSTKLVQVWHVIPLYELPYLYSYGGARDIRLSLVSRRNPFRCNAQEGLAYPSQRCGKHEP
jgi:hypothetical protein